SGLSRTAADLTISGFDDPGADDGPVVLAWLDLEVDMGDPSVIEGIAKEIEHALPRGSVRIVAKLETESVGRAPDELHHHLDIYAVGRRPVSRAAVVDTEEADLTTRIEGHGYAPC